MHNGQLQIIGTGGDDNVSVSRQGNHGPFRVQANFLNDSPRRVSTTGFDAIVMVLGAGDDDATIAGNLRLPAVIDGGAGDDHLNGGKGRNLLIGGTGADHLNGGSAADLLIGGTELDRIVGNGEDDLLVAGSTRFEDVTDLTARYAALAAILAEWSTGGDPASLAAEDVFDDDSADNLTGSSGSDWFFIVPDSTATNPVTDIATDLKRSDRWTATRRRKI